VNNIKLNILGLSYSQTQDNAYVLILVEEDGQRRIPIIIGGAEAQSIAIQLENLKAPRPLTHDLFLDFSVTFGIEVTKVVIYKLEEGIFYSKIVATDGNKEVEIDARTSDAVALAVRFGCSIYTSQEIISKAGIVLDTDKHEDNPAIEDDDVSSESAYAKLSISELEEMLNEAIEKEDYEKASNIRDELNNRKND